MPMILNKQVIQMTEQTGRKYIMILFLMIFSIFLCSVSANAEVIRNEELKNNRIQAVFWTDETGKPICGPDGYARIEYTYKNRNTPPITIKYLDQDGKLYLNKDGYAKVTYEYGNKNLVAEINYYGTDNQPCMCNEGYSRVSYKYTMKGELKTSYYYDARGRKVTVPSLGYASLVNEYLGNDIRSITRYDTQKNPVDGTDGFAILDNTMNRQYHVLESRYLHADKSPATGPDGWHHAVYNNDSKGKHLSARYYGENDEPYTGTEGVYEYGFEYDEEGRIAALQLMSEGQVVAGRNGWSKCCFEYDSNDRKICTRYYDQNGAMTDRNSGYAYCRTEWNDDEGFYTQTWYDLSEQPIDKGGYVKLVSYTSTFGKVIENRYLNGTDEPTANSNGIFIVRYDYDEYGRLVGSRYYDDKGLAMHSPDGYASFRDVLDENGFLIKRTFYDADTNPVKIHNYVYDDAMNIIEIKEE